MSDYTTQIHEAGEQYLTTLAAGQERFVEAVTAFVKQIPTSTEVPSVPSPGDITAASFDFADKLLTQNRAHADQLLATLVPASV